MLIPLAAGALCGILATIDASPIVASPTVPSAPRAEAVDRGRAGGPRRPPERQNPGGPTEASRATTGTPPRYTLDLGSALGAFTSRTSGWVRSDAALHFALGLRLHRWVQLRLVFLNSAERLEPGFRAEARYLPWGRGFFAKAALDLLLAGVGPQPALALGVGYAWWFRVPIGLWVEIEAAGRVRQPLGISILAVGGLCAHFGR